MKQLESNPVTGQIVQESFPWDIETISGPGISQLVEAIEKNIITAEQDYHGRMKLTVKKDIYWDHGSLGKQGKSEEYYAGLNLVMRAAARLAAEDYLESSDTKEIKEKLISLQNEANYFTGWPLFNKPDSKKTLRGIRLSEAFTEDVQTLLSQVKPEFKPRRLLAPSIATLTLLSSACALAKEQSTAIHSGDVTPSPESAIYRTPLADTRVEKTPTGYTIATITPEQTPSPTLTVTEEINLKVSTDTWSTDSNGQINKEIMAEVVNRALIEDKYAFDMKLGPINVAIVEDEDLTEVNAQILVEKRNKVKDEFDDGLMNRCLSQILKFMPELRKELRDRKLNLSDSQIIIERDYDGELQVTNIIVNGLRMFMSDPQGELFRVPDRTPENRQFYGLDNVIPMFPDLKVEERKYIFSSSDHMIDEYLPPPREDSRIIVVDDPTGILGGKVFQSEIFSEFIPDNGIPNDNDRHRSYYPGPYRDPFNPPHSENQDDVGWEMPIEMTATIYFDLLEFDIGVNVHELGSRVAGEGKQIYAMAGDYHVPFPGLPPDYHEDRPATNTLLAKHEEKLYILPMSHDQDNQFFIGSFVNLNASIPEKQWVQFKTISTKDGIWTLMRLYGTNRYRVMGYVKNYNPDMPAFSVNFGPYALPTVSSFRVYQQDLNVSSWGDVVYFPPGGPQP